MSWRFVFDSTKRFRGGTGFDEAFDFVVTTGYKFFTFNGGVYFIADEKAFLTGITVEDLF